MLRARGGIVKKALPKKTKAKVMWVFVIMVGIVLIAAAIFAWVSPIPASFLVRAVFEKGNAVPPDNYRQIKQRVNAYKDLRYPSQYEDNLADVYLPMEGEGPFPVVLWVHGGAFVGGSKRDIEIYATALADEGMAVVCMNYRRAPEAKYPTPVVQTQEVYLWLKDVAGTYSLDMNRFILAGDSAGAHIAAQYAAIQSNADYAAQMGLGQVVPIDTLKAALLFCGPYDLGKISEGTNPIIDFFIDRTAWAYFGTKGFNEELVAQTSIAGHVSGSFPPAFISDGNSLSFEEHARDLADVLTDRGVSVETYFIPIEIEKAGHEYQFVMNTPAGEECFGRVVQFIKNHIA